MKTYEVVEPITNETNPFAWSPEEARALNLEVTIRGQNRQITALTRVIMVYREALEALSAPDQACSPVAANALLIAKRTCFYCGAGSESGELDGSDEHNFWFHRACEADESDQHEARLLSHHG